MLRLPFFLVAHKDSKYLGCTCIHSLLSINQFKCYIKNNTGCFECNNTMWVAKCEKINDIMMISQHCPLGYCLSDRKVLDLTSNPDTQCNSNHTSTLRGGCKNHFSLAIGSSQRIQCSSNSYMSLFLFFIAGTLLIIFILALNLIVTQELINGLISMQTFLWTYTCRHFFSLRERQMTFVFQIFIAWLNLDFDWGLFCCWSDCLLENMASVSFPTPYLAHCWSHHH